MASSAEMLLCFLCRRMLRCLCAQESRLVCVHKNVNSFCCWKTSKTSLFKFMSKWHPIKDACCTWSVFLTQLVLVWKSSHLTQHKDSQLLWVKSRFKSGSGWIMCLFPSKRCQKSLSAFSFCLPLPSNSEASLQKFITLPNVLLVKPVSIFTWPILL